MPYDIFTIIAAFRCRFMQQSLFRYLTLLRFLLFELFFLSVFPIIKRFMKFSEATVAATGLCKTFSVVLVNSAWFSRRLRYCLGI